MVSKKNSKDVENLRSLIEEILDSDKASDIESIDLAGKSSIADYMIVATGLSQRHLVAISEHIVDKLEDAGYTNVNVEGDKTASDWVVVDAGVVIVHLFRHEKRGLYNLEKMWATSEIAGVAAN